MLPQQIQIDTGLDIKALGKGAGHHVGQVPIALLVAAQQHQMPGLRVELMHLVKAGAGGHVDLAADDGLDPLFPAGPVEVDGAEHHAVVGDGHSGLSQLPDPLRQLIDAAGSVQQGVFRMQM